MSLKVRKLSAKNCSIACYRIPIETVKEHIRVIAWLTMAADCIGFGKQVM